MPGHEPTLDELVTRARALGPEQGPRYLREACHTNEALYSSALHTLSASPDDWWSDGADAEEADEIEVDQIVGKHIGPYRVVGVLGTGGMGQVVLAERADDEFRRKVAIKFVRSGYVSKQLQRRLRLERQILAELDHPNIARLLDGGTTAQGVPYIVMEYIDGAPIDVHCNKRSLTIPERLDLFRTVCSAVHYAHQNLIVHRDLKPSNVLVTTDGSPKLLDFGIAKLLDARQLSHTLAVTRFDSRLMTPDHASPEQVRGELVTTASDIYVLGVLLYELLTARKPFLMNKSSMGANTPIGELERVICEQPPLPLSYGLNREGRLPEGFLFEICRERSTTPSRLRKDLSGDLQNIVAMALRKEPDRRYSSVEQLSADISRYLQGLPVLARRDTWTYRARKFVSRHAVASAAATAALIAATGFTVTTVLQSQRIENERMRAEEVSTFLTDLFEHAAPDQARGRDITVQEILATASRRLQRELHAQPETQARLLGTLGTVYRNIGRFPESEEMLRASLRLNSETHEESSPEVADAQLKLGDLLTEKGQLEEAERMLEAALASYRRAVGDDGVGVANSLRSLGKLRQAQQKFDEAAQCFAQSARILESQSPPDSLLLTAALNDWAILLMSYRNDPAGAEALYRRAIDLTETRLGPDHPDVATATHNLAIALDRQGKLDLANPLYEKSVAIYKNIYGENHPETAWALANYGRFLQKRRNYEEAEQALTKAVELQTQIYGANHTNTAYSRVNLALLLLETNRAVAARGELESALRIYALELPADHQYVGAALLALGRALIELNLPHEARAALDRAETIASRTYGAGSPPRAAISAAQGGVLIVEGNLQAAEPLLRDSYPVLLKVRGSEDMYTQQVRDWITTLYEKRGQKEKATEYFASVGAKK